jgi:hypothetical protein
MTREFATAIGLGAAEQPANAGEERRPEIATHRLESVVSKNTASRIPFLNGMFRQRAISLRISRLNSA